MQKRSYTAEFKTKVILELLRGEREVNEIASEYEIAPNQLRNWKAEFLDNAVVAFDRNRDRKLRDELDSKQREADQLAKKVGQLTIEVDFLKKTLERKELLIVAARYCGNTIQPRQAACRYQRPQTCSVSAGRAFITHRPSPQIRSLPRKT
jgi:transposase-like protein